MLKRKGVIEIDKYTKVILTVIAVLLALHLVKPWLAPKEVIANPGMVDVNIAQVAGYQVYISDGVPAHITNPVRIR